MNNEKLLTEFYKRFKLYPDEKFKFLIYPGVDRHRYVISNYGRIFSVISLREKKVHSDKDGYLRTSIIFKTGRKNRSVGVHRLVAYTFIKNHPEICNLVNHKDGNKTNNFYKNLEWTTPKGNTRHAIRTGLQINSGPNCPSAIYSENIVRKICKLLEDGYDVSEIYKFFIPEDKTIKNKAFYALIFSIKSGKRHKEISKEYNIPENVISKQRKKFTKEEIDKITLMMDKGYTTSEIIKEFGGKTTKTQPGKRIFDKIQHIKKLDYGSTTREN